MEQKIRTFICIDFPSEIIKEVARIQQIIEKQNFQGKLTELENLHITLKFLGEIDPRTLETIKIKLSKISFPQLNLKLSSVGTFNFHKQPRIVWIKVAGNLFQLQKQIDEALSDILQKEQRFMSHLTIARIKHAKSPEQFIGYISKIKTKPIQFTVDSFKLKSSELLSPGPVYTTLEEYKLQLITSSS